MSDHEHEIHEMEMSEPTEADRMRREREAERARMADELQHSHLSPDSPGVTTYLDPRGEGADALLDDPLREPAAGGGTSAGPGREPRWRAHCDQVHVGDADGTPVLGWAGEPRATHAEAQADADAHEHAGQAYVVQE